MSEYKIKEEDCRCGECSNILYEDRTCKYCDREEACQEFYRKDIEEDLGEL